MLVPITTAGRPAPEPASHPARSSPVPAGAVTVMKVVGTPHEFVGEPDADDWRPFDGSSRERAVRNTIAAAEPFVREGASKTAVATLKCRNTAPKAVPTEVDDAAEEIIETTGAR